MKELWTKEGKGVIGQTYRNESKFTYTMDTGNSYNVKFFCAMCKDELDRDTVAVLSIDLLYCTKAECKVLYALRNK